MNCKLLLLVVLYNIYLAAAYDINDCPSTVSNVAHRSNSGYYIGYAYNDCSSKNIYMCKSIGYRYGVVNCYPDVGGCFGECIRTYYDCYTYKGEIMSFMDLNGNPFTNPKRCNSLINVVVNANDDRCFVGPSTNIVASRNNKKRVVGTMVNNDGVTPRMINGRCLTGEGWCSCQKYVPAPTKTCPSRPASDSYSCQGGKNYCIDRCYRKLKDKKWSYGNAQAEIGNSYIPTYCHLNICQQAFDDYRYNSQKKRTSYWEQCKSVITSDFNCYHGLPYTISNNNVDY